VSRIVPIVRQKGGAAGAGNGASLNGAAIQRPRTAEGIQRERRVGVVERADQKERAVGAVKRSQVRQYEVTAEINRRIARVDTREVRPIAV
jgi:hypothetical protein